MIKDLSITAALSINDRKYSGLASATDFAKISKVQLSIIRNKRSFLLILLMPPMDALLSTSDDEENNLPYCSIAVSPVVGAKVSEIVPATSSSSDEALME